VVGLRTYQQPCIYIYIYIYIYITNVYRYDKTILEIWVISTIIGPYDFADKSSVISTHVMTTYSGRGGGGRWPITAIILNHMEESCELHILSPSLQTIQTLCV
jgi:hypothetical protein